MGLSASTPIPVASADYGTDDEEEDNDGYDEDYDDDDEEEEEEEEEEEANDGTVPYPAAIGRGNTLADPAGESGPYRDRPGPPSRQAAASTGNAVTSEATASSSSPQQWKKAFAGLTDGELHDVIMRAPVSERDVRAKAGSLKGPRLSASSSASSVSSSMSNGDGTDANANGDAAGDTDPHHATTFYTASSLRWKRGGGGTAANGSDGEGDITDLCFRILRVSPTMARLRFRLVPTKMREHEFWMALLAILYDAAAANAGDRREGTGVAAAEAATTTTTTTTATAGASTSPTEMAAATPVRERPPNPTSSAPNSPASGGDEKVIFNLRRKVEKQEWTIEALQREILALREQQQQQQQQQQEHQTASLETTTSKTHSSSPTSADSQHLPEKQQHQHAGEWIMDQDSIDFLSYPPELKDNLRSEKRKRLEEVKAQMRFILDSDDVQDSNGRWSCCGQTEYHPTCPAMGGEMQRCTVAKK